MINFEGTMYTKTQRIFIILAKNSIHFFLSSKINFVKYLRSIKLKQKLLKFNGVSIILILHIKNSRICTKI